MKSVLCNKGSTLNNNPAPVRRGANWKGGVMYSENNRDEWSIWKTKPPVNDWYFSTNLINPDKSKGRIAYLARHSIIRLAHDRKRYGELAGLPIRVQLEKLGFLEAFDRGATPLVCPYTLFGQPKGAEQ